MKIDALEVYLFSVPVKFQIALWDTRFSSHCVALLNIDGVDGCGSGVLYKNRPLAALRILRQKILPFLESAAFTTCADLRKRIQQQFAACAPCLAYALDSALWDIEGKMTNKPVSELLGIPRLNAIPITEQLFISEREQTCRELAEILDHGTRHIKVKIGRDPVADVERVKSIRNQVPDDIELGVDINEGYTFHQAIVAGKSLKELAVCMLEDPLPRTELANLAKLREEVGLPIMLDAGIQSLQDLRDAIDARAIDALNLKLTRIGGLTSALKYAQLCAQNNVRLSIGCSEDLGPGMASILHLASVCNDLYSTEGVGPARLGFDIVDEPFVLRDGCLALPHGLGLGVAFNREKLDRAAQQKHFTLCDARNPSAAFIVMEMFNRWYQRWFTLRRRVRRKIQSR